MSRPGAAMSGLRRMGEEARRGPREEKLARVSAAVAAASVALTPGRFATIVLRSAWEIMIAGMVTWTAPVAPMAIRFGSPATLLPMMTPMAPAACALFALTWKPQVPRSISAMLPATAAALVRAVQPSVVLGPEAFAASSPWTMAAVWPEGLGAGVGAKLLAAEAA